MKVYIVEVRQGQWDSTREFIASVFTSKALADHYVHKLQCTFKKCHDYYKSVYDIIDEEYEKLDNVKDYAVKNVLAEKYCHYMHRKETFETPYCHITTKELIGLKL